MASDELDGALTALLRPLEFLARRDFQNTGQVKGLESLLGTLATRLTALVEREPELAAALTKLIDDASRYRDSMGPVESSQLLRNLHTTTRTIVQKGLVNDSIPSSAKTRTPRPTETSEPTVRRRPVTSSEQPVKFLSGVGPKGAEALAAAGIETVSDLLWFFPRQYLLEQAAVTLAGAQVGAYVRFSGRVVDTRYRFMRGRRVLEVLVSDGTGSVTLTWFRSPSNYAERFRRQSLLTVAGKLQSSRTGRRIAHPEVQFETDAGNSSTSIFKGIVPIYPKIEAFPERRLHKAIDAALASANELSEDLPEALLRARSLPSLAETLHCLHQPWRSDVPAEDFMRARTPWHRRLIYEEFLLLQLPIRARQRQHIAVPGTPIPLDQPLADVARATLPFTLTSGQALALADIDQDLRRANPMHRLVQGDVGSGKTAVALAAAAGVALAGLQAAIMAPTEVLATQHMRGALKLLSPRGIRVALLTGSVPMAERRKTLQLLRHGTVQIVVGTHALIQEGVVFRRLALAIVDEQHRFGVSQRAQLAELGRQSLGTAPHVLFLTATPIPRTLALTIYGDLEVSTIKELPPGRSPITTTLLRERDRERGYALLRAEIAAGRQGYVVFPLVERSESEGFADLRSVVDESERLAATWLSGLTCGVLHGKLSADEKNTILKRFADGELHVLMATTVVEVGIDVPNATVMIIEHAERFGLSQLHQLRGRVGRGVHRSHCILVARAGKDGSALGRLRVLVDTQDGFTVAEEDLAQRGPGDLLGTRQSGIPVLTFANLARDQEILNWARDDADMILDRAATDVVFRDLLERLQGDVRVRWARVG